MLVARRSCQRYPGRALIKCNRMHGDHILELLRLLHRCFALRKWYKKVDGLAREVQLASLGPPVTPAKYQWDQAIFSGMIPAPEEAQTIFRKIALALLIFFA